MVPISQQEYFGWIGNAIFFTAQLSQIVYTYKIKSADDLSYVLFFFFYRRSYVYNIWLY